MSRIQGFLSPLKTSRSSPKSLSRSSLDHELEPVLEKVGFPHDRDDVAFAERFGHRFGVLPDAGIDGSAAIGKDQ
jgi:hypothetical protein